MEYKHLKVEGGSALTFKNYKMESPIPFVIHAALEVIIDSENNYISKWCTKNHKNIALVVMDIC